MTRLVYAVALAAVLSGLLTGCASQEERYCDAVKDHQTELGRESDEGGPSAVLQELPTMEALADEAPSDIKDEWQTLLNAVRGLDTAFDDAGVDPASYDPKQPPEGLSEADQARIKAAAANLGSNPVRLATAGIEQEALDICQTPIGL